MKVELTSDNFNQFLENQKIFAEALNHRMTDVEKSTRLTKNDVRDIKNDMKWFKKIGAYMTGIQSAIVISIIVAIFKLVI